MPANGQKMPVSSDRHSEPLSIAVKAGYGLGLFGLSIAQTAFTVLLMYCYTDVFGLSPAKAGLIVLLGSIMDILVNLAVPWFAVRLKSPLGRYRPLVIYGAPLFAVFLAAMFIKPGLSLRLTFVYALLTHMAYRACYAFILTPHSALISQLSADADERASLGAYKAMGINLGTLSTAYAGLSTIEWLGGADAARGFLYFGLIFGATAGLAVLISGLVCRERVRFAAIKEDVVVLTRALGLMARNSQLMFILASTLVFYCGYMLLNGAIIYYFKYIVGRAGLAKMALLAVGAGGVIALPLWVRLNAVIGKARIWSGGCLIIAISLVLLSFLTDLPNWSFILLFLWIGAGKAGVLMNYFALTADAVDYGHWRLGQRAEGYSFGLLAIVNKTGTALGGGLLGILFSWSGFEANHSQTAQTVGRLTFVTCIVPALFFATSALIILGFKVTASRHRQIIDELVAQPEVDVKSVTDTRRRGGAID
jgi:GPH family glycoside/pentoside/hexuronide:cation symporter